MPGLASVQLYRTLPVHAQMDPSDFAHMPPFPFPAELFPKGTFPKGMKTTREILTGLPPSVLELIETGKSGKARAPRTGAR